MCHPVSKSLEDRDTDSRTMLYLMSNGNNERKEDKTKRRWRDKKGKLPISTENCRQPTQNCSSWEQEQEETTDEETKMRHTTRSTQRRKRGTESEVIPSFSFWPVSSFSFLPIMTKDSGGSFILCILPHVSCFTVDLGDFPFSRVMIQVVHLGLCSSLVFEFVSSCLWTCFSFPLSFSLFLSNMCLSFIHLISFAWSSSFPLVCRCLTLIKILSLLSFIVCHNPSSSLLSTRCFSLSSLFSSHVFLCRISWGLFQSSSSPLCIRYFRPFMCVSVCVKFKSLLFSERRKRCTHSLKSHMCDTPHAGEY